MAEDIKQEEIVEKLRDASWVMLTTATDDGKLVAHPMTQQQVTDDADAYFFFSKDSGQGEVLTEGSAVNIAVSEAGSWLSVAGTVRLVEDKATIEKLWDEKESAFSGPDDPKLGLILVESESAQFWGTPGGKVQALAQIIKRKIAGGGTGGGSATVEL